MNAFEYQKDQIVELTVKIYLKKKLLSCLNFKECNLFHLKNPFKIQYV